MKISTVGRFLWYQRLVGFCGIWRLVQIAGYTVFILPGLDLQKEVKKEHFLAYVSVLWCRTGAGVKLIVSVRWPSGNTSNF